MQQAVDSNSTLNFLTQNARTHMLTPSSNLFKITFMIQTVRTRITAACFLFAILASVSQAFGQEEPSMTCSLGMALQL